MISTKQLIYALAVQKTLHFKKAAEQCHISQSALSTAITEFERQLGVQVFERDNKKVLVTPLGQQVLAKVATISALLGELQTFADGQKEPLSYPMSVGVIPTIGPYILPRILPAISADYPNLSLQIVEEQSHVLVEMVREGELDTAILALPYNIEGLLSFEFWQEDFYWVTNKQDTHANQQEITSHELKHMHLMLLKDGHCLKDHALEACKLTKQTDNFSFGATSLNTLVQMVAGGMGSTLVPAMAMDQLIRLNNELAAVHLNEPGPHRRIAFIVRPTYTGVASIEKLKQLCQKQLSNKC